MKPRFLRDIDALNESELRAAQEAIESRLKEIREKKEARGEELGQRLASFITQVQSEGYDINIMSGDDPEMMEELNILADDSVIIRVR